MNLYQVYITLVISFLLKRRSDRLENLIDPLLDHRAAASVKHSVFGILPVRTNEQNGWIKSRIWFSE